MTVSSTVSRVAYAGDGTTLAFTVPFYFLDNTHLKVILTAADGTEAIQSYPGQYGVAGAGNPSGGTVTMVAAPAVGVTLTILRNVPATQLTDYVENDPFPAETHERALDKLTMLVQQIQDGEGRALTLFDTDSEPGGRFDGRQNRIVNVVNLPAPEPSEVVTFSALQDFVAGTLTGSGPAVVGQYWTGTTNGALAAYAIPGAVLQNPVMYLVALDGITQRPTTDYTIDLTGPFVVFASTPAAGLTWFVRALAAAQTVTTGTFDASAIVSGIFDPARLGSGSATPAMFLRGDLVWSNALFGPMSVAGDFSVAGQISGQIDAANITSGIISAARLGGGVPSSATFLRGDNTWAVPPSGGGGALPPGGTTAQFLRGDGAWSNTILGGITLTGTLAANLVSAANVTVSGGVVAATLTGALDAANLTGSVAAARMGSGSATSTTLLHGDNTWGKVAIADHAATGTPSASTFLCGDNTWKTPTAVSLGTAVDDPLGAGVPTTADNTGFYRGDGKFSYALKGGVIAVGNAANQYVYWQMSLNRAQLVAVKNDFSVFYPIEVQCPLQVNAGSFIANNDAADTFSTNNRARFARVRYAGSAYRKITRNTNASGALSLDANVSEFFSLTITGNATLTLTDGGTDPSASSEDFATSIDVELINVGASTITWAASSGTVTWVSAGSAPTLAGSGSNILRFTRRQGVTGWVGYLVNAQSGGSYTDEQAQDAVGGIFAPTATITPNYSDVTPSMSWNVNAASIGATELAAGAVTATKYAAASIPGSAFSAASIPGSAFIANSVPGASLVANSVPVAKLLTTGTANSTTFLRGDGQWTVPPAGGGGIAGVDWARNGIAVQTNKGANFTGACTVTAGVGGAPVTINILSNGLPVFNVADYGALGNGVHDDTAALQAAYDAAKAAGGGIVYLPVGDFKITSTLFWNGNVSVLGQGCAVQAGNGGYQDVAATRIWWAGAAGGTMIYHNQIAGGFFWQGFHLVACRDTTAGSYANAAGIGIQLTGLSNAQFRNITIYNTKNVALELFTQLDSNIYHCTFENLYIDVGSITWGLNSASPSTSTAIGVRMRSTAAGHNTCINTFNNISIVHNYIGYYLEWCDTNSFVTNILYAFANTVPLNGVIRDIYCARAADIPGGLFTVSNVFYTTSARFYVGAGANINVFGFDDVNFGPVLPYVEAGGSCAYHMWGPPQFYNNAGMYFRTGPTTQFSMHFDVSTNDIIFKSPTVPAGKALASM